MTEIQYRKGDATLPQTSGPKIVAHICNDQGSWGKGFVLAVSKRWTTPEAEYRAWHRNRGRNDFALGAIQVIQVASFVHVANMIGQHGIAAGPQGPPIRYDAVGECLQKLAVAAKELEASVHMPRIGTGPVGGKWELIEPLIQEKLIASGVKVYVYDLA